MKFNNLQFLGIILAISMILILLGHHMPEDVSSTHAPIMLHDFGGQFQRDYFISNWPQVEPPFLFYVMWGTYLIFGQFIGFELFLPLLLTAIWIPSLFLLLGKLCERRTALFSTLMISLMGWGFNTHFNTRILAPHAILWALAPLILYLVLEGFKDRKKELLASVIASISFITHPLTAIGLFTIIFLLYAYNLRWKGICRFLLFCIPLVVVTAPFMIHWYYWDTTQEKLPLDSPIMLTRVGTLYPKLINFDALSEGLMDLSQVSISGLFSFWRNINHEHLIIPYILFVPVAIFGIRTKDKILGLILIGSVLASFLFLTGIRTLVELQVYRNLQFALIPLAAWFGAAYFKVKRPVKFFIALFAAFIVLLSQNFSDTHAMAQNLGLEQKENWCGLVPQGSLVLSPPELSDLRMCGYQLVVTYKDGGVAYYSKELGMEWWKRWNESKMAYDSNDVASIMDIGRRYNADFVLLRNHTAIKL
jgi:hypothetical protein